MRSDRVSGGGAEILLPDDVRELRGWRRVAVAGVGALDRTGRGRRGRPVARTLSERKLWGALQRGRPRQAPDRPLIALSFDLDYQEDTDALPRLLDTAARVGARMSVVAVGALVERDPGPYRDAVAAGHEIVNHTWSHPDNPVLNPDREFWHLTVDEMVDEISRAQDVFARELGVRPHGFRSPHFKDTQRLLDALDRVPEITYASSTLATTTPTGLPYFPARDAVAGPVSHLLSSVDPARNSPVLQIPLTACPDHRWSPMCSYHAIRRPTDPARGQGMHDLDAFERQFVELLAQRRDDGFLSFYFDPKDVMRDDRTADRFARMLSAAVARGWRLTSLGEVAAAWREVLGGDATAR